METTFNWRTAPRSIKVLMDWLPYFVRFESKDYQLKISNPDPYTSKTLKNLRPTRREIRYAYESDSDDPDKLVEIPLDEFLAGKQPIGDTSDKESLVRQVVTTAEQYGFMNAKDAEITPVGRRIVEGTFTAEDFLAQLLKMYIVVNGEGVFPFKTVIKLLAKYGYLSRSEMTFVFGQIHDGDYDITERAVGEFRRRYESLPLKNNNLDVEKLLSSVWNEFYIEIKPKQLESISRDYTDALRRSLEFTDLFYSRGRGLATKIYVSDLNKEKFDLLLEKFNFVKPPLQDVKGIQTQLGSRQSLDWYGKVGNVNLPWDNVNELRQLINSKLEKVSRLCIEDPKSHFTLERADVLGNEILTASISSLKDIEFELDNVLAKRNEQLYVHVQSQTDAERQDILDRFETILTDKDMSALWLEVNTWRAFVALSGENKHVVHNFKMNPDLTPKSFAPGSGNTPDMEVYFNNSLILPEVSLMTGVQQWEHEGSSVIEHVYRKIEQHKKTGKNVIGLFISSRMNIRTMWQFFLLNKESWIGDPIPVVPMTITQFSSVLETAYKSDLTIYDFAELIEDISKVTKKLDNYNMWAAEIESKTHKWISEKSKVLS